MRTLHFSRVLLLGVAFSAPVWAQSSAMVDDPCARIDAEVRALPAAQAAETRRARDWPNLCHYAAENAALRVRPRVVFIGDSITEGWKKAHPAFFSDAIADRGISGQTTPQMLARFYADVVALRPQVVHIMAGTNDIAGNTGPSSRGAFENNIRAMVDLARAHHIRVVIGAIPPADRFAWARDIRPDPQIRALNTWLRDFARRQGARFVDYHAAMTTPTGAMQPSLSRDGVHPNAAGYAVMEPLALAAIR